MLFMIQISVALPGDMPAVQRDELRRKENDRAIELIKEAKMLRIWRCAGRVANFSLWQVNTLEELHAAVQSLPMYPYMEVAVTPVIEHPVTQAYQAQHGQMPPL